MAVKDYTNRVSNLIRQELLSSASVVQQQWSRMIGVFVFVFLFFVLPISQIRSTHTCFCFL